MSFVPGDEVVCVSGTGSLPDHLVRAGYVYPKCHCHYIVRKVTERIPGQQALLLAEIINPPIMTTHGLLEVSWIASPYFRPVRRETIEVFRQMCVSNKPLVKIE